MAITISATWDEVAGTFIPSLSNRRGLQAAYGSTRPSFERSVLRRLGARQVIGKQVVVVYPEGEAVMIHPTRRVLQPH